jgi:hypothetical protein
MSIKYPLIIAPNFLPPAPKGTKAFWGEFQSDDARYGVDQWGQLWEKGTYGLPLRSMWPYTGDLLGYTNDGHGPTLREWAYRFSFIGGQLTAVNSDLEYRLRLARKPMPAFALVGPGASRPFEVTQQGDAVVDSVSVIHAAGKVVVVQVEMETKGCRLLAEATSHLIIAAPNDSPSHTIIEIPFLANFECQCVTLHARYAFRLCALLRE